MAQLRGLVKVGKTQEIFNMLTLKRTTSDDKDFLWLIKQLDHELRVRYGELQTIYDQYDKVNNLNTVVIVYNDMNPAGCGCFKKYNNVTIELKRMFVSAERRGMGIGALLVHELEKWAAELNYNFIVLETGIKQPEAIHLYQKLGYTKIPNYDQYKDMNTSVCFKKNIIKTE